MANLTYKVESLYNKLRKKYSYLFFDYRNRDKYPSVLSNITVVYPDYYLQYKEIDKNIESAKLRRKRLRRYVRCMAERTPFKMLCLASLTFTDDVFKSTDVSTRKKYVRDYLNQVFDDYIACIDFGKQNGREHYHAICLLDYHIPRVHHFKKRKEFFSFWCPRFVWQYGFSSFRPITYDSRQMYTTCNYAFKSSNYAFKCASKDVKPFHKRNGMKCDMPDWL